MRIVLRLHDGEGYAQIGEQVRVPRSTISRRKGRCQQAGLLGLATIHPGQSPQHRSLRKMAAVMKVNKNLIARIWREAELKPHRLVTIWPSNNPQFEEKVTAIVGLYLEPPQNAAMFCVNEKSAIQALHRIDQRLPLCPGRAEKHGFEYRRNGILSLYAA